MKNIYLILIAIFSIGCGDCGEDEAIPHDSDGDTQYTDKGGKGDNPHNPDMGDMGSVDDTGIVDDDTGVTEPEPEPTTDAVQFGPTVEDLVTTSCSTITVKGLSTQLIDQMNCEVPGIMKSFAGSEAVTYSAVVFPFMQGSATDALIETGLDNSGKIPINSALRSIAQQYLLVQWFQASPRLCDANKAAAPGGSNHNGGAAVDIGNSSTWRQVLRDNDFIDDVSDEAWHFRHKPAKDVRSLSILAFQKLYNRNFPTKKIDEDGIYGPQTGRALAASPGEGFSREPVCDSTQAFVAYPAAEEEVPMDVDWETDEEGSVELRVIATAGIRNIEILSEGKVIAEATQDGDRTLRTSFKVDQDFTKVEIEIRGYGVDGALKGKELAQVNTQPDGEFRRPLGDGVYEIGRASGKKLDFELKSEVTRFSTDRGFVYRLGHLDIQKEIHTHHDH